MQLWWWRLQCNAAYQALATACASMNALCSALVMLANEYGAHAADASSHDSNDMTTSTQCTLPVLVRLGT